MMDSDAALPRISRMWERLGRSLERSVLQLAENGQPLQAIHAAVCAEVCFWRATGEDESLNINDILPTKYRVPAAAGEAA